MHPGLPGYQGMCVCVCGVQWRALGTGNRHTYIPFLYYVSTMNPLFAPADNSGIFSPGMALCSPAAEPHWSS